MTETEQKRPNERRLDIDDGKYTFVLRDGDYRVQVLRHREPWLVIEQGCNAIWSLVARSIDDQALIDAVRAWAGIEPGSGNHGDLHEAWRRHREQRGEDAAMERR